MKIRLLLLVLALMVARPASANYDQLFAFGDSLSDSGNAALLSGGLWPPTPTGRFSNGPVAAEYLANALGIASFGPSGTGGTNYAVGGATTGLLNYNKEVDNPAGLPATFSTTGMTAQLGAFLGAAPVFDPASTLFMVWGGANDFFLGVDTGEDPLVTAANAVTNLANIVGGLASFAGAQKVLVPLMPDLGLTPFGIASGQGALLSALSAGFNAGLAGAMGQVEQATGVDVILFDTVAQTANVLANPAAYGFTNTTGRCIDDLLALASNCAGYLYLDDVHPTTAGHAVLAAGMFRSVPEPGTVWLLIPIAFAVSRSLRRR